MNRYHGNNHLIVYIFLYIYYIYFDVYIIQIYAQNAPKMTVISLPVQLITYLSFAAATPGNSLPSRNSSDAPPPVEI